MWTNQIFSLIHEEVVQNIIVCDNYEIANQIARAQYGEEAIAVDTTQYPLQIGNMYKEGGFYNQDGIKIPRNLTFEEESKLALNRVDILDKQVNPSIDYESCTLEELKDWQIKLSNINLENYLCNYPIFSSCHKTVGSYYSITKDKQAYLAQMIMMSQMAMQAGVDYQPSWNATGEPCTYDWTIAELQQLAFEMEMVVRPLVSHQQAVEAQINVCNTKDEVLEINIDFGMGD